jgi:dephospho-CoA kinase
MSAWPEKTIIGLTGNIATGKSVVRTMLEHLGAFGIDADGLAHRSIARGAPGYAPVLEAFGETILAKDGQIDRPSLARLVFTDPAALAHLEKVVHPLVGKAIDTLVRQAAQPVIVLEAIKLIEAGLSQLCDFVWVTYAPESTQQARLMQTRGMSPALALQRIHAQPLQETKTALADVIVHNVGSFSETWQRVLDSWQTILPVMQPQPVHLQQDSEMDFYLERAWPPEANQLAALRGRLSKDSPPLIAEDIMAAFGRKTYLILYRDGEPVGICGWRVQNLVALVDELYLDKSISPERCVQILVAGLESLAHTYQCEALLFFLQQRNPHLHKLVIKLGYQATPLSGLETPAWQEAAMAILSDRSMVHYKRLGQAETLFYDHRDTEYWA